MPRDKQWHAVKVCQSCTAARRATRRDAKGVARAAARAARQTRIATKAAPRPCLWCLRTFTPKLSRRGTYPAAQHYCCKPHQAIAKSVRRKARLRGAAVGEPPSLWAIYERDGGRCALCLDGVDRSIRWPDTRCASLDHIIPISRGGTDGSDNVQLAHLACNIRKQDRLPGEAKRPRRAA